MWSYPPPTPMIVPLDFRKGTVIHVLNPTFQGMLIKKIDLYLPWLGCKGEFLKKVQKVRRKNVQKLIFLLLKNINM